MTQDTNGLMPPQDASNLLLWLDLETTGLSPQDDPPLEIAVVITEAHPRWVERCSLQAVLPIPDWRTLVPEVLEMHTTNGLMAESWVTYKPNPVGIEEYAETMAALQQSLLDLLAAVAPGYQNGTWVLAGSGSDRFDRAVIGRWMPEFAKVLAYKGLDISPIREALRIIGRKDLVFTTDKPSRHRAMDDVRHAIAEWEHYARLLAVIGCPDCGAHRDDECREGCTADRGVLA